VAAGVFESGLAHYESHGRAEGRLLKGYRPLPFSYKLPDFEAVLSSACDRLAAYNARGFRRKIAPDDDMVRNVEDPAQHYFETGQSALQVILRGLILAQRTSVASILDMPCGGGRVTRHLTALFPEAEVYVSDINRSLASFAAKTLDCTLVDVPADFSQPPPRQFELVFVGSLLTHLPEPFFCRALDWYIEATAPGGVLIVTLHGRIFDSSQSEAPITSPGRWSEVQAGYEATGFGYMETGEYETPYGVSLMKLSWLMKLIEVDARVRLLGFEEGAYAGRQDALILLRLQLLPAEDP
jgi:SAM-dependent methyltransferase